MGRKKSGMFSLYAYRTAASSRTGRSLVFPGNRIGSTSSVLYVQLLLFLGWKEWADRRQILWNKGDLIDSFGQTPVKNENNAREGGARLF